MIYLFSRTFIMLSFFSLILSVSIMVANFIAWCAGTGIYEPLLPKQYEWIYWVNWVLLGLSIVTIFLSIVLDGKPTERKRVFITFIPNLISLYLITAIEMIIGFPGLFKCHNQKVWKKTAHNMTSMSTTEERHKEQ